MKSQRTHIARFLIIVAMALIGVYASLKPIRTVGAIARSVYAAWTGGDQTSRTNGTRQLAFGGGDGGALSDRGAQRWRL